MLIMNNYDGPVALYRPKGVVCYKIAHTVRLVVVATIILNAMMQQSIHYHQTGAINA